MINFIVCDKEKNFTENMKTIIDKFMMGYDYNYKVHSFISYGEEFAKIINAEIGFKVYFLSSINKKSSDMVKQIREKNDDWASIVVIIMDKNESLEKTYDHNLAIFSCINKQNKFNNYMNQDLKRIMSSYDKREKSLSFNYNHVFNKVEFRHINCIEKEIDSKKCIIHTSNDDLMLYATLSEMLLRLDERFIKVHRSMIVNIDRIDSYDIKNNIIVFKDKSTTDLISRSNKKELLRKIRSNLK